MCKFANPHILSYFFFGGGGNSTLIVLCNCAIRDTLYTLVYASVSSDNQEPPCGRPESAEAF